MGGQVCYMTHPLITHTPRTCYDPLPTPYDIPYRPSDPLLWVDQVHDMTLRHTL